MKHATIESIGILMVQLPKGAQIRAVDDVPEGTNIVFKNDDDFVLEYYTLPKGKYSYIAPFEDMSEEQFAGFVPEDPSGFFKDYHKNKFTLCEPYFSFLSAVEASGYKIGVMGKKPVYKGYGDDESISDFDFESIKWHEAQSRTFDPALTHIFKIEK